MRRPLLTTLSACLLATAAVAVEPETAQLSFDSSFNQPDALKQLKAPEWITKIEQSGGAFVADPKCWQAPASASKGVGRITIGLDRRKMNEDLVATVFIDSDKSADVVVQLFDGSGRVVEVDLFGNLVEVGNEARTDTYVIPLQKYPTAESIVIRRVVGDLKVYGLVLYPTVTEGVPNQEVLRKLAGVLGDPLSPENPLSKSLREIANVRNMQLERTANAGAKSERENLVTAKDAKGVYPAAVIPRGNANPNATVAVPTQGLAGYWSFDQGDASDLSGKGHHGRIQGGAAIVQEGNGHALRTRKNPSKSRAVSWDSVTLPPGKELAMTESMTISAWVKYASIAGRWGSQIAWFGNSDYGRDPWTLQLLPGGTLGFRSDRSVTGQPKFAIHQSELYVSPSGKPMMNQHVSVWSPAKLQANTWYFVAGSIEKLSPRSSIIRLYVNGEVVGELKTPETVNYPTDKMWMTIGAVDLGTYQNFDGLIDEVRLYDRSLSGEEIKALYGQPWK